MHLSKLKCVKQALKIFFVWNNITFKITFRFSIRKVPQITVLIFFLSFKDGKQIKRTGQTKMLAGNTKMLAGNTKKLAGNTKMLARNAKAQFSAFFILEFDKINIDT